MASRQQHGFRVILLSSCSMLAVVLLSLLPYLLTGFTSPFLIFVTFIFMNFFWARFLHLFFDHPNGKFKMHDSKLLGWNVYMFHMMWPDRILGNVLPVMLMPLVYKLRGAKVGANFFPAGKIVEPELVTIGNNVVMGENSFITAHEILNGDVFFAPVTVGDNVTIGMHAVISAGVQIGPGAVVAANSCVLKNVIIGPGEIWAGNPASPKVRRSSFCP